MKLAVTAESIDAAKKSAGTLLLFAGAIGEIFAVPGTAIAKVATAAGFAGAWLLGLGMLGARGRSAQQLLEQVFGTTATHEIAPNQVQTAARIVSRYPPDVRTEPATLKPSGDVPSDPPRPRGKP